jgi:hypothetical protein
MFFGSAIVLASVSLNWVNFFQSSGHTVSKLNLTSLHNHHQHDPMYKNKIDNKFKIYCDGLVITLLMPKLKIYVGIPALTQN